MMASNSASTSLQATLTELAALVPQAQASLAAQQREAGEAAAKLRTLEKSLTAREEALAAKEAVLAAKEAALAEREASVRAGEEALSQGQVTLKQRDQELARKLQAAKKVGAGATEPPTASAGAAPPVLDNLGMQILARATATALLKHGTAAARASRSGVVSPPS